MNQSIDPIVTTSKEIFTSEENQTLARLVLKRFGYDTLSATLAWRRLMQNNCSEQAFMKLAGADS